MKQEERKELKRKEAEKRQEVYDKLTPEEKIAKLDKKMQAMLLVKIEELFSKVIKEIKKQGK